MRVEGLRLEGLRIKGTGVMSDAANGFQSSAPTRSASPSAGARGGWGARISAWVRDHPRAVIVGALDVLAWALLVGAVVSVVSGLAWSRDLGAALAALIGDGAAGGAVRVLGGPLAALGGLWRLATWPVWALLARGVGVTAFDPALARLALDAVLAVGLLFTGVARAVVSTARVRALQATAGPNGMEAYLSRRLDDVYRRDTRLAARARQGDMVREDAGLLAPWCAKFMSFQEEQRPRDETELDKGWLKRVIVLNVALRFPELPSHQTTAAKGWISELVVAEMSQLVSDIHRIGRKGPARLRRTLRNTAVGAVLFGGAIAADQVYRLFGG